MRGIQDIQFRLLPGQSKLYLEYLDSTSAALRFYRRPPTIEAVSETARETLPEIPFPRRELTGILERQNSALAAGPRTFDNIHALAREDCAAVVTGQQVGLFTGPLYTIYKALAAVRIAAALKARKIQAVPVFWMECEDHDVAEVTHSTTIGTDFEVHKLDFHKRLFGEFAESTRSVGTLTLPDSILKIIQEYFSLLPGGGHADRFRSRVENSYKPGVGFPDAFGLLMADLFREFGLIFFNPGDREAKHLMAPVFRAAVRRSKAIYDSLAEKNRMLSDGGFHSQVSVVENSTVLFLRDKEERRALVRNGERFAVKGNPPREFNCEDLIELAKLSPESFSPNVLLRPLIQDHLFPTAAYVAGPAEIAYFAQVGAIYELFNRPMPVIWPRPAFTLLEPDVLEAMQVSGLQIADCLRGRQVISEKLIAQDTGSGASRRIRNLGDEVQRVLEEIRPEMVTAEASLGPALDTARRKIAHNIDALHSSLVRLELRRDGGLKKKADLILNYCYPNGNLQEREFGAPVFLVRHGSDLLNQLYSEIRLDTFVHRAIAL